MQTALVVGASGRLGIEIVKRLREARFRVRTLVRHSTAVSERRLLEDLGCELLFADLKDDATLIRACTSMDTVISTATAIKSSQPEDTIASVDERGQLALVAAAEAARVRHFVYVSFPPIELSFQLQDAKRSIEARLRAGQCRYTLLQPGYFLEVWFHPSLGFSPSAGTAAVFGDGKQPVSWISLHDVAQIATNAALRADSSPSQELVLSGSTCSQLEVLAQFEKLGLMKFSLKYKAEHDLESRFDGATNGIEQAKCAMTLTLARGLRVNASLNSPLLPIDFRTPADFARAFHCN